VEQFRQAIVYGKSVKHQPQRVGLNHELADEDIITIIKRWIIGYRPKTASIKPRRSSGCIWGHMSTKAFVLGYWMSAENVLRRRMMSVHSASPGTITTGKLNPFSAQTTIEMGKPSSPAMTWSPKGLYSVVEKSWSLSHAFWDVQAHRMCSQRRTELLRDDSLISLLISL